jgi:hypothetical protein
MPLKIVFLMERQTTYEVPPLIHGHSKVTASSYASLRGPDRARSRLYFGCSEIPRAAEVFQIMWVAV